MNARSCSLETNTIISLEEQAPNHSGDIYLLHSVKAHSVSFKAVFNTRIQFKTQKAAGLAEKKKPQHRGINRI